MLTPPQTQGFFGLGIAPRLLDVLDRLKYATPTPIQQRSIPVALEGKDVIGIAQTGTGKTLAFSIPMIQRLAQVGGQGLVILPTRELALQVHETMEKLGRTIGLRSAVLIGGTAMGPQLQAIRKRPHVIIATPGRLIDHLEQRNIELTQVRVLVLDEADRMLDMGFAPQIARILRNLPRERQTMLFSATMPTEIVNIAAQHMSLPVHIEVARAGTASERVTQELFIVSKEKKLSLLKQLLDEYRGSVLVFSRTKYGAKKITRSVIDMHHTAAEIHSNRSLAQRKQALEGFKNGRYRVLIATDIAARGIDVTGIELVINFDLPDNAEDYVHRIGRTGRAGREGHAISFATPDQHADIRAIERLIRGSLKRTQVPSDLPVVAPSQTSRAQRPEHPERHAPRSASHRTSAPQRRGRSHGGGGSRRRY